MARKVLLGSYLIYLHHQITLITLLAGEERASPDLRRGLTGAAPGVADEEADSEGWTEKSETWSVSLISLRTLLAR